MERRKFVGHLVKGAAVVAIVGIAGYEAGCTIGTVLAQLEKWLPVGLQAFAGVVAIINPPAGSALFLAVVAAKALWTDISTAIAAYNAAPAASKTTALGKVETAIGALLQSLPSIVSLLGGSSLSGVVSAALDLIEATLGSIDAQIGGTPPVTAMGAKPQKAALSPADFKKQFNSIVTNGGFAQYALN
jgi:hypothetical protein